MTDPVTNSKGRGHIFLDGVIQTLARQCASLINKLKLNPPSKGSSSTKEGVTAFVISFPVLSIFKLNKCIQFYKSLCAD